LKVKDRLNKGALAEGESSKTEKKSSKSQETPQAGGRRRGTFKRDLGPV